MANFNFNKSILGGRLTSDVELKTTPNGVPVCTFTLAVNRKASKDQTDFISCVAWRTTAEFISRYFTKGSPLCVVGAIQTRNWTDQNGNKKYATEVVVDEAMFVDSKSDAPQGQVQNQIPYNPYANAANTTLTPPSDDDLPF